MVNEFQLEKAVGPRWKEWNSGELHNNVFLGGQRNKRTAATFPFFSAGSRRAQEVNGEGPIKINLNLPVSSSVTVAASSQKSGSEIESNNINSTTAISMMSTGVGAGGAGGGQQVPTTRDTLVVLITLTIILITLVASYYFWKKNKSRRRSSYLSGGGGGGGGAGNNSGHSVYMYSRLSQNDVEVDNISFQGDLTHKALVNQPGGHGVPVVPSCGVDDDDDDQVILKKKLNTNIAHQLE